MEKEKNISVKEASEMLGVSQPFIREGLKSGRLPIGSAVQINEGRWTFHISPGLLKEYMTGSISLRKYFEENREILKAILEGGD